MGNRSKSLTLGLLGATRKEKDKLCGSKGGDKSRQTVRWTKRKSMTRVNEGGEASMEQGMRENP